MKTSRRTRDRRRESRETRSIIDGNNNNCYRFARAQTVFNVALEYHAVRLREPERLVDGLQGVAFGREPGEDGRVHRTPFVVDDLERALRVLGHGHAAPREYTVRCYRHADANTNRKVSYTHTYVYIGRREGRSRPV